METNIHKKIEDKIIDWIALGSNGRLIAFKPENGADLIVQRKGDYQGKKLSFKIFTTSDTQGDKNFYSLFTRFDSVKQKIDENIWLAMPGELKYQTDKNDFINFLIKNLISENKPSQKTGFIRKQY